MESKKDGGLNNMERQYNKLVRDKIPSIIRKESKKPKTKRVNLEEKKQYLCQKLIEESEEFANAKTQEELADVLEVMETIIKDFSFSKKEINIIKKAKRKERGSFKKGIILLSVKE